MTAQETGGPAEYGEAAYGEAEGIQSVDKALAVLDVLADPQARHPLTLAELARRTGFHRSSVNRCIVSLVRAGYVQVDRDTQRYQLGPRVLRLAQQFLRQSDVVARARPYLVQLRDATGETAFFSVLSGEQRVVVAQEESLLGLRRSMEIGVPGPLHCGAMSKAILAFAGRELVERVLSRPLPSCGPGAVTNRAELRRQLASIREQGYAAGQNELVQGSGGVCAPVFDHRSVVIGSLGIAGPLSRLTVAKQSELAPRIVEAARALSEELGYTPLEKD